MSAVLDEPVKTNLAALRKPSESLPSVTMGFSNSDSFALMQRAANLLASSTLVPKEYQGNLPNCVIALNMSTRIGADPLMVMQNLYVVHGRPGWSAQFLIATFNQCGRFTSMRFDFFGEAGKDDYGCRAYATEKATGEKIVGSDITIKLAKSEGWEQKAGSKWKTMPQQMLMYRAAAWLVRAYAPEIAMGLQTGDEIHDVYDAERDDHGSFTVGTVEELRGKGTVIDGATGEISPAKSAQPDPQDEALKTLEKVAPAAQEAASAPKSAAPVVTYAHLSDRLNKAWKKKDIDLLDAEATMIGMVADEAQREDLTVLYKALRKELAPE